MFFFSFFKLFISYFLVIHLLFYFLSPLILFYQLPAKARGTKIKKRRCQEKKEVIQKDV